MPPALELRALTKDYDTLRAVDAVDLVVPENSIVGLVGESGSGKSTTGLMAMRLTEITAGQVLLSGMDITALSPVAMRPHRRAMQIIFQDSYSALDPMMTLADIIAEPLRIHRIGTRRTQRQEALSWFERVGLSRDYANRYPHELSGGQRQRVAVARALILKPKVLVADEPTSALDVSVKAQIVNLLQDLQADMGLSILFISHDLSVVRSLTDQLVVMYHGRVVEKAPTEMIFQNARHPYTRALLNAVPVMDPRARRRRHFATAEEIAAAIPAFSAAELVTPLVPTNTGTRLAEIAPGHFVEARIER
ncbi:ABC transporter ATP-binding protein [Martelella sp. HB161492]|uniref:ATP-binding cassette domain-containing protein n=1 Tax=Martelella sp. HB161492 TaxID=2720726 RepID=UPI00159003B4|nr:ABC transporter ATP-binding protein [Martelella sp. HB161492]